MFTGILTVALGRSLRRMRSVVLKIPFTFALVIYLTTAHVFLFIHNDLVLSGFKLKNQGILDCT